MTSFTTLNSLQWRELFNLSPICKCFTTPLHNSILSYNLIAFPSFKQTINPNLSSFLTVRNPASRKLSGLFSRFNHNSSLNLRNCEENLGGFSLDYRNYEIKSGKRRKSGERFDLGEGNEKGSDSFSLETLNFENGGGITSDSSLSYSNYDINSEKRRKSGERFDLGEENEKGSDSFSLETLNFENGGGITSDSSLSYSNYDINSEKRRKSCERFNLGENGGGISSDSSLSDSNYEIKSERRRKSGERFNLGENGGGISSDSSLFYSNYEIKSEKRRKSGERFNLGEENEKGSDNFSLGKLNFENGGGISSDSSLSHSNYGSVSERVGKGGEEYRQRRRKSGERFNFGKGNEKGSGSNSFDRGRKGGNNNGDSGWGREYGHENFGKIWKKGEKGRNYGGSEYGSENYKETWKRSEMGSDGISSIKDNDDRSKVRRKEKLSKKNKVDSVAFQLRIGLDMCSKMGDVMGAISLYDSAVNQGIKMGQHQYTVLLYLCSSAAMGVIRPAKSGSSSRSLDKVGSDDSEEEDEERDENANLEKNEMNEMNEIKVGDDVKKYALERGLEVYERMCFDEVEMNEAALTSVARMAMAMGNGDMAFDMVKQMKSMGINPKLRSYGPALSIFSSNGDLEKAFAVEKHMLENGVHPEEPELEALLRVSIHGGKADRVYYILHKLRTNMRAVSPTTAELIEKWFTSREASRVGKRKWDKITLAQTVENVGGGWHGQGWLGSGKWTVSHTSVGTDGLCRCCGEKLALIDLDPEETERFAESVASIAVKKDRNFSFQKFQRWLDYYGPFEAVVDAANVGLLSQRKFKPSKVNAVVNGIRQLLPSKKWPLIILHNRRVSGGLGEPMTKAVVDKWRNADALYATPTGSNDDWYWLYAAIKFKCLLVTNDEMRDHTFQLLGNDFFPKWKERHQVRLSFSEIGPVFYLPPPCSVVIQESDGGFWHIPIASEHQSEGDRIWLCISRPKVLIKQHDPIAEADP